MKKREPIGVLKCYIGSVRDLYVVKYRGDKVLRAITGEQFWALRKAGIPILKSQ